MLAGLRRAPVSAAHADYHVPLGATTFARKAATNPRPAKGREPAWLAAARAKVGTREAPGTANNPNILDGAKRLGTKVLGVI